MRPNRTEAGFALIMALLILTVLTFLGLALATTTSTELQIGYNYKWGLQAQQNAEAGLELAKRVLRQQTWVVLVPPARRTAASMTDVNEPAWQLNNLRDFENRDCDSLPGGRLGVGYGVVLQVPGGQPFQNTTSNLGESLGGAFTVWVRRPTEVQLDGSVLDSESARDVIVTVEGVAPFQTAATATSYAQRRQAIRTLEVALTRVDPGDCENDFTGQSGMGALGSNYDPCGTVGSAGVPNASAEINPNQ
jgi:hypothetical protein